MELVKTYDSSTTTYRGEIEWNSETVDFKIHESYDDIRGYEVDLEIETELSDDDYDDVYEVIMEKFLKR